MAKYEINHACGHTVTHNIGGKTSDRDGKAEWLSRRDCPDCWAAQKKAEKEAEEAKAKQLAEGLPPLIGTEKQIAWAEKIRAAVYVSGLKFLSGLSNDKKREPEKHLRQYIDAATDAHWWIDNRSRLELLENSPSQILLEIAIAFPSTDEYTKANAPTAMERIYAERDKRYGKQAVQELEKKARNTFCVPAHAIARLEFIHHIGKYIVELEFPGHPKQKFWISEKQARGLDEAFAGERYSTKANTAFVILEDTGDHLRFVWAVSNAGKARSSAEHFGASWGWPGEAGEKE
jgi:hypothetical protein